MNCNKCNNVVQPGTQFCPNCGNKLIVEVNSSQNYSQPIQENQIPINHDINNGKEDKANVWLVILSWFIPIAGLIIFFVKKEDSPKTAKASGLCALISFIINLLVIVISFVLFFSTAAQIANDTIENTNDLIEEIYEEENEDQLNNSSNVVVTNDWKSYQVSIGDTLITLPTTYEQLSKATGFSFKETDINVTLNDGYYATLNMYKNGDLALYTEVLNTSGVEKKYIDCKITRLSQTKYQVVTNGAAAISFPGNIKAGQTITETEIISLFGEPNDTNVYSSEGYESKTYVYLSDTLWTTTNNFKITVVNGIIDEIQLDHRD